MPQVAIIAEQGARPVMEDTYYFADFNGDGKCFFGGVYDGHGGSFAAEYARKHLHKAFFRKLKQGFSAAQAYLRAYEQISAELSNQSSGAVAVNFYLKDKKVFYANAGDARLIVTSKSRAKQLTEDHRITNLEERARVLKAGARIIPPYVVKAGAGLMPTRTLGDEYFKDEGVIATPAVGEYSLRSTDQGLLAGTDGLFDYLENQEIVFLLSPFGNVRKAAARLRDEVLVKQKGRDNVTFILLLL